MIKWITILFLSLNSAFALEAVVKVLEAPLFKERNLDAQVVQYLRKGDILKIYPLDENNLSDDEFIPTVDKQGHISYILSKHIYIYFNDSREFSQEILFKDPTDYRLKEPLPDHYPFKKSRDYKRGVFTLGFTLPNQTNYRYPSQFKAKGYNFPLDLNFSYLQKMSQDQMKTPYVGVSFNFRQHKNSFLLADGRTSDESGVKFGVGPTISYDLYNGALHRINLSHSILLNLYQALNIKQADTDERQYQGNSVSALVSTQYHRKKVFKDLDLMLGTFFEVSTNTTYKAKNAGKNSSWWQNTGSDSFTTGIQFNLCAFLGIKSEY